VKMTDHAEWENHVSFNRKIDLWIFATKPWIPLEAHPKLFNVVWDYSPSLAIARLWHFLESHKLSHPWKGQIPWNSP
jgi:hypothetical protein